MIVLFTIGQMCKAQGNQLLSGNVLKAETQTKQVTINRAPAKVEAGAIQYWVNAMAHFDQYGWFDASQLAPANCQATVTFDGDEVTLEGMVDFGYFTLDEVYPVKGHYDATARTITISTPGYDGESPLSTYTSVGKMMYFGSELELKLFAGAFSEEPDEQGQYGLETVDELVFDVSEDLSTLTARTGYGCYGFYTYNESGAGFLNFYKTATYVQRPEGAALLVSPSEVMLEGPAVTAGASVKTTVKVSNIGLTATEFAGQIMDSSVEVYGQSSHLEAGETSEIQITIHPTQVGLYQTTVKFFAENGSETSVVIKANVAPAPDFSPIVKQGDIVFSLTEDKPFVISNDVLDVPVAVSTNEREASGRSSLVATVTVPEGKTGILSWKGMGEALHPNGGTQITLDGSTVFDNVYDRQGEDFIIDPIDKTLVLGAGTHDIEFDNVINMNSYLYGYVDKPFRTYVYDMTFDTADETPHAAMLMTPAVDFGRHYVDKLTCQAQAQVILLNAGTEPLQVLGFEGDGTFDGIMPEQAADYGQELAVTLTFETAQLGEHNGQVVIKTNAGDFTVDCSAATEALTTDYSPIVEEGEFSFNTSADHPFIVEENTAYSSTAYIDFTGKVRSWLDAEFVVPAGCQATLAWSALNSSEDWFNFMGQLSFNDGTRITIDDTVVKEFCGEADASSGNFSDAELTFAPGRHKVRFLYEKMLGQPKGDDRVVVSELALHMTGNSAVQSVSANAQVVKTEVYSVAGHRLSQPQQGVNIVRETLSDGTQRTTKILVK